MSSQQTSACAIRKLYLKATSIDQRMLNPSDISTYQALTGVLAEADANLSGGREIAVSEAYYSDEDDGGKPAKCPTCKADVRRRQLRVKPGCPECGYVNNGFKPTPTEIERRMAYAALRQLGEEIHSARAELEYSPTLFNSTTRNCLELAEQLTSAIKHTS